MVAMVRTSGNSGYYVDIFRSDRADNDYLFHHVGTSMEITDSEGNKLPGEALEKFDKRGMKDIIGFPICINPIITRISSLHGVCPKI